MEKILKGLQKDRRLINMISGSITGVLAWLICIMVERFFGLNNSFQYISQFIVIGTILGTTIGMISNEVLWHKNNHSSKKD
jgi:uncharacterized membrane protein